MTMLWSFPNPDCPPTGSAPQDVEELNGSAADERRNLLSLQELAEFAGVPLATVYKWNRQGSGPPYYKVGRTIQHRLSDVQQWSSDRRAQLAVCSGDCGRTFPRSHFTQAES